MLPVEPELDDHFLAHAILLVRASIGRRQASVARLGQSLRRAATASLKTCNTVSESSQPMQASVMLWP